ncbi:MAG TPA: ImmA/IrrE family metallo-endopeptidase [Acidiferrobacter sp.]|nr:ImmA/IrrE family metallo-endopeptidase [Acidiferrobacter sp.]
MRHELGLRASDPLDPFLLARKLGVTVWTPHDVPGLSAGARNTLLRDDGQTPSCWSAVTLVMENQALVILNSSHSRPRQASDLTHELAHRIRGHEAQEVDVSAEGLMLLKSYEKLQEEEADWLSGCLLLPREALISIKKRRLDPASAANEFGVSVRMFNYRMTMTGVSRQFR